MIVNPIVTITIARNSQGRITAEAAGNFFLNEQSQKSLEAFMKGIQAHVEHHGGLVRDLEKQMLQQRRK